MNKRESNFELLRIIAMFLIVIHHVLLHGNVITNTTGLLQIIFEFINLFTKIHVDCFILIMGYFQSKSEFKIKKVFSILFQVWFYNILLNCLLKGFRIVEYTNIEFINAVSPFNLNSYWFIYCYLIMYMLTPFINKAIEKLDKISLKKIIVLLICIFGIVPYATMGLAWTYNIFSVEQFILIYFIGAYIRKYELDKKLLSSINKTQKRVLCVAVFCSGLLINFTLYLAQKQMITIDSNTLRFIGNNILSFVNSYSNPILIAQSIAIFILFSTFSLKSKTINYISSLTLGVYLMHDGWPIRGSIYKLLGIDRGEMLFGISQTLKVIIVAIIIFITGLIVEAIRQHLNKLVCKLKFVQKTNNKLLSAVEKLIEIK